MGLIIYNPESGRTREEMAVIRDMREEAAGYSIDAAFARIKATMEALNPVTSAQAQVRIRSFTITPRKRYTSITIRYDWDVHKDLFTSLYAIDMYTGDLLYRRYQTEKRWYADKKKRTVWDLAKLTPAHFANVHFEERT